MFAITIDAGARSFVALCSCGWRSPCLAERLAALVSGQRHIHHTHPGSGRRIDSAVANAVRRSTVKG